MKVRRALVSVSNKEGLLPFVQGLRALNVEILSTGGTAHLLREQGIPVKEVAQVTGFPEILGGRVKTLHPKIHGGILVDRKNRQHLRQAQQLKLPLIDLVVVNLYPFEETARRKKITQRELIEQIDIGGVTLIRSAAKNSESVGIVSRPAQYKEVLQELRRSRGVLSDPTRMKLAVEAFAETAYYDSVIHQALAHRNEGGRKRSHEWPERLILGASRRQVLRYGENPHQPGVWYEWFSSDGAPGGLNRAVQLHGKELSLNNLLDLDAALEIVGAFKKPCSAVVKHNNPCGVACGNSIKEAFERAFGADPLSAFGGIVGLNRPVDEAAAKAIVKSGFLECILAPGYKPGALQLLKSRKNLRIMQVPAAEFRSSGRCVDYKQVRGGMLAQRPDEFRRGPAKWRVVSRARPSAAQSKDLLFAWTVARFVRSNSIVVAKKEQTVGIGTGQTSRVDSVWAALRKAGPRAKGAVLASDGFFPKPDGPAAAVRAGVRAIVQPGGSVQDGEVTKVADRAGAVMLMTGERHFRH